MRFCRATNEKPLSNSNRNTCKLVIIVFLLRDEGQQLVAVQTSVTGCDLFGCRIERNTHCQRPSLFRFARDIFNSSVDDALFSKLDEVAHTTTDQTLKNEDVALNGQLWMAVQIGAINFIPLVDRDVIRCSIGTLFERKIVEWRIVRLLVVLAPIKERPNPRKAIQ